MDFRKIKQLIELLKSTGIAEIEIKEGEESVRIRREHPASSTAMTTEPIPAAKPLLNPPAASVPTPKPAQQIRAPMVGTVYLASTPESKPFVEVGQIVKAGDIVCLIEAMKMFNQIEADKSGTIVARLVENGTTVEYNQPLFTIE